MVTATTTAKGFFDASVLVESRSKLKKIASEEALIVTVKKQVVAELDLSKLLETLSMQYEELKEGRQREVALTGR